jgi:GTP-binding protein
MHLRPGFLVEKRGASARMRTDKESMKIVSAEFELSAGAYPACPVADVPEFALIGRSNVGKSTLLNRLAEREGLARVSDKPGFTRTLNFFRINRAWRLVDLPGYGFAKTGRGERERFVQLIQDYITQRSSLLCTLVLVDASIPPQGIDLDFVQWIGRAQRPFALVFTKQDKAKGTRAVEHVEQFMLALKEWFEGVPPTFSVSAKSRHGVAELRAWMAEVMAEAVREKQAGGRGDDEGASRA